MEFIVFILFCAVVVLIFIIAKLKNSIEKNEKTISTLQSQLQDLYGKSYYMYGRLKALGAIPGFDSDGNKQQTPPDISPAPDKQPSSMNEAAHPPANRTSATVQNIPAPVRANVPMQNISAPVRANVPMQNISAPVRANVPMQNIPAPVQANVPMQNISAPVRANVPMQSIPAPVQANVPMQNISAPVRANVPMQNIPAPAKPPKEKKHIEEWLGARLFNIAASLLIFIGLILFCTLSTEQVTNTMKMIAMFVVSGGFIAVGAFLARKDRSIFPLGMLGTGFGTFFISILLSHVYFHSLGEIPAFSLILVWSALALLMSKKLDSIMLSVTAHIGTAVSLCFAFSQSIIPEKIVILTIYQMAALAVIIIGNIFCCRKTYRFGLIMSQCLLVYTSIAMSVAFSEKFVMPKFISVPAAIVIYAVQFAAVCFVSYLVSTSSAALEKEGGNLTLAATAIHVVNKLLWTAGTISSVVCITVFICRNAYHVSALIPGTIVLCAAGAAHFILTLIMEEKLNFSEFLSTISLWFTSLIIAGALFTGAHESGLPFVFLFALVLAGIFKYTKLKGITPISAVLLLLEAVYMSIYGYFAIENVWVSIPYMFGMGVVLLLLWFVQNGEEKQRWFKYMKIAEYLWISVSIISINASEFSDISFPLIMSEFALMNIICWFIKFGGENEIELRTVVKAESLLTVYIGMISFCFELSGELGSNNIIKAVFVVMIGLITAVYAVDFARSKSTALQVISSLTAAGFVTFLAVGFSEHFKIFDIYTNILFCLPFVFIAAAVMLLICVIKKNIKLDLFIWIAMILDMLYMSFDGYRELAYYATSGDGNTLPLHLIITGISLAHAAALLGFSFVMHNITESNGKSKPISRFVSYFWINLSFPIITYYAFFNTNISSLKLTFAMIMLTIVNTAVFALKYQGDKNTPFNWIVRVTSAIAFYTGLPVIAGFHGDSAFEYACCVVLSLTCAALFFVKSRDILKSTPTVPWQIYIGFNATLIVNCACSGLSNSFDFAYIFSIVTMITALLCITAGFISKAKGLRIYGLIVVMICIIKLVTVDISGADSLARVLAFVVGGIVCFIISGIYNTVEKKMVPAVVPEMAGAPASSAAYAANNSVTKNAPSVINNPIAENAPSANNPADNAPADETKSENPTAT